MGTIDADVETPALIVKVSHEPLHSGGLGVIRTLGRLGIPVYTISEDSFTPAALSRYCSGHFRWRTIAQDASAETLLAELKHIGQQIGQRSVVVATDDEAATLVAENARELADYFLMPEIPRDLPRQLANKHGLYALCQQYDVPAPKSALVSSLADAQAFARLSSFPVVAKNAAPWVRLRAPLVASTTVLGSAEELLALIRRPGEAFSLLLQEYIPREHAEDWIIHLYSDRNAECLVLFSGVKLRSWPPHAGSTSCAYAVSNPALAELAARFCKQIGFCGIADLDWRLDLRDGLYKLVDFNPRVGNQFRLFETTAGIDVVRALHLDMTGRQVPFGEQANNRRIIVEHFDVGARLAYRRNSDVTLSVPVRAGETELAWAARDDPLPFLAMWPRIAPPLMSRLADMVRKHLRGWAASRRRRKVKLEHENL